jgi:hypothetical protein
VQPFKGGVAALAAALALPVVPAAVVGTRDALPKERVVPVRARVAVAFGAALPPPPAACAAGAAHGHHGPGEKEAARQQQAAYADALRERVIALRSGLLADSPGPGAAWPPPAGGPLAHALLLLFTALTSALQRLESLLRWLRSPGRAAAAAAAAALAAAATCARAPGLV